MKKLLVALALAASFPAYAASICPTYEFAELQTFSDKELAVKKKEYFDKLMDLMGSSFPNKEAEKENCREQGQRIDRILKSRQDKKASK